MGQFVYPTKGVCWWCGAPADSREHKYKRSDIVREFGEGPYQGGQQLVVIGEGSDTLQRGISGPASKAFKFDANLCRRCNNERSQPFDRAYDAFTSYISANSEAIRRSGEIDLAAVYGDSWPEDAENLVRYFVKHIGCRVAGELIAQRVAIDTDLNRFLDGGPVPACLRLDACIDSGLEAVDRSLRAGSDALGERNDGFLSSAGFVVEHHLPTGTMHTPQSSLNYRWFALFWQLDPSVAEPLNPFTQRVVRLNRTGWRRLPLQWWAPTLATTLIFRTPFLGPWYARRAVADPGRSRLNPDARRSRSRFERRS